MAVLFNMSEAAAIGIHCCMLLAENKEGLSSREIASMLDISLDHCVKVLHTLSKAGIIHGTRGPAGGFQLVAGADKLSVLKVYESIEGKLCDRKCLFKKAKCRGGCPLFGNLIDGISSMARTFFEETTIRQLAKTHSAATQ